MSKQGPQLTRRAYAIMAGSAVAMVLARFAFHPWSETREILWDVAVVGGAFVGVVSIRYLWSHLWKKAPDSAGDTDLNKRGSDEASSDD